MTCLRLSMIHKGTGLDWFLNQTAETIARLTQMTGQLLEEMKVDSDG